MDTKNVEIGSDKPHTASELEEMLKKVPIRISGSPSLRLRASLDFRGVIDGRIYKGLITIEPTTGQIKTVEVRSGQIGPFLAEHDKTFGQSLSFTYGGQNYYIKYQRREPEYHHL